MILGTKTKDKEHVPSYEALCVNQENVGERNQQVQRMAGIYPLAERVIVWLGPESGNSKLALDAMENLSTKIRIDRKGILTKPATLGPSEARDLMASVRKLFDIASYDYRRFDSLEELIYQTHQCKCVDERDKIIGLLSMLCLSARALGIIPDYDKTSNRVYEDVVERSIRNTRRLTMLFLCEMEDKVERREINGMQPSLVPDFARPKSIRHQFLAMQLARASVMR